MDRLAGLVLRHRRLIAITWLVALLGGGLAAAHLSSRLSQSFEIPGTPSARAGAAILARYHSGGSQPPLVAVVRLPAGQTASQPAVTAALASGFAAVDRLGAAGSPPSRISI